MGKTFPGFLDFLNLEGITIEGKAIRLYNIIQIKDTKWFEDRLIDFFTFQNERVDKGELSPNTIKNYYKPVKLFCEISNIFVNWKLISRGIKSGNAIAEDRSPSLIEIQKLVESSNDMRIKVIVSVMISSGIRVGSWDYLKWKHITPIQRKDETIAAKIECYNTKTKWYYSFLTLEAYNYLKSYINFRKSHGDFITGESWLLRDTWKIKRQRFGNYLGLASKPIQLKSSGIRSLINKAWKIHGIRGKGKDGKRFEFKNVHGFRKFFETECQKVMNPVNIFYLMSHTTGVVQNYYRPKEEVLLQDYIKAIDLLTISEEHRLSKKVLELQEKDDYKNYVIDKKMHEKEEQIKELLVKVEKLTKVEQEFKQAKKESKEYTDRFAQIELQLEKLFVKTQKEKTKDN